MIIDRPGGVAETLPLLPDEGDHHSFISALGPAEPHEFDARLCLEAEGEQEVLPFRMVEPEHHH